MTLHQHSSTGASVASDTHSASVPSSGPDGPGPLSRASAVINSTTRLTLERHASRRSAASIGSGGVAADSVALYSVDAVARQRRATMPAALTSAEAIDDADDSDVMPLVGRDSSDIV